MGPPLIVYNESSGLGGNFVLVEYGIIYSKRIEMLKLVQPICFGVCYDSENYVDALSMAVENCGMI